MSTPDIRITLRRDVKEGNIKIETYISDFEILKKTIDELQRKLNTMDVVKKSGDTMIGDLRFVHGKLLRFLTKDGSSSTVTTGVDNLDRWYAWSDAANKGIFNYDPASNLFNLQADTNLVKKAGDIINGILEFKIDNAIVLGSRSFKTVLHKGAQGALIIAPSTEEQGDTWDWSKRVEIRTDGTIKQATDTGWIKLPTTGVENVANRDMKYKRSGENISVIGSVRNPQNEAVFATLPVGFRPVQHIAFPALAYGYTPAACEVTIKPDGGIFVNGVPSGSTVHIAMSFLI